MQSFFMHADNEDWSDYTDTRLIWVFVERMEDGMFSPIAAQLVKHGL